MFNLQSELRDQDSYCSLPSASHPPKINRYIQKLTSFHSGDCLMTVWMTDPGRSIA